MIKYHYYLFDMDGTLFFTDDLNNESYNYALRANNFPPICSEQRITREVVKNTYPEVSAQQLSKLIQLKQDYFISNITKVQTNEFLFKILRKIGKDQCVLWTSADKERTDGLISEFDLNTFFIKIIRSGKKCISQDIKDLCTELACECNQLLAFENDPGIVSALGENNVSCLLFVRA